MKLPTACLLLLFALAPAATQAGEERIKMNAALQAFRSVYIFKPNHKAFAQSPDGGWAYVSDRTSAAVAASDALASCSKHVKPGQSPCLVIHIDDQWMP
jgi:hypothetical protein